MNNIFAKDTRTEMYSSNLGRIGEQFGVSRTTSPSSMRAAIYCRLSKDDGDFDSDSSSIQTQRDMLEHHCSQQGWEVTAVYQDDGFTGLNMNRPDLQRMLKAVERRQIDVIVTKDLSRLSRNYIEIGQLMEEFFPKNSVRYVALNDGVDSDKEGSSDMTPFRAVMKSMR
jgi:DNA invertase Pin-like site-specific DNA recombinase